MMNGRNHILQTDMKVKRIVSIVKKIIKEYFEYELYSYLWIQLNKDDTKNWKKKKI